MAQKSKRGRKKKFPDLLRRSIWLEKETIDQLEKIAALTKVVTGKDAITFSDVVRKLLDRRIPALLGEMRKLKKEKELQVNNELEGCLVFSEQSETNNQPASSESVDQFSWKPNNGS